MRENQSFLLPIAALYNEHGCIVGIRYLHYANYSDIPLDNWKSASLDVAPFRCTGVVYLYEMRYCVLDLSIEQAMTYNKISYSEKKGYFFSKLRSITRILYDGTTKSNTLMLVCVWKTSEEILVRGVDWEGNVKDMTLTVLRFRKSLGVVGVGNCDIAYINECWDYPGVYIPSCGDLVLTFDSDCVSDRVKEEYKSACTTLSLSNFEHTFNSNGMLTMTVQKSDKNVLVPEVIEAIDYKYTSCCETLICPEECDVDMNVVTPLQHVKFPRVSCVFKAQIDLSLAHELYALPEVIQSKDGRLALFQFYAGVLHTDYKVLDCSKYKVWAFRLGLSRCNLEEVIVPCAVGLLNVGGTSIVIKDAPKLRSLTLVYNIDEYCRSVDYRVKLSLGGLSGDVFVRYKGASSLVIDFSIVTYCANVTIYFCTEAKISLNISDARRVGCYGICFVVGKNITVGHSLVKEEVVSSLEEENKVIRQFKMKREVLVLKEDFEHEF